jgi:hypothetical protein
MPVSAGRNNMIPPSFMIASSHALWSEVGSAKPGGSRMHRREFIAGLGSGATWSVVARAQQRGGVRVVGVLMNAVAIDSEFQSYVAVFIQGLHRLGWVEAQNLRVDVRWNAGNAGLSQTYAAQLIGLMPDVILVASTTNLTAIRQATSIVPVVFVGVADPVAQGFVASVRQPGGNLTGFSLFETSLGGKWLNLLKDVAPGLDRVAVMFNPDLNPYSKLFIPAIAAAAPSFGVEAIAMPIMAADDIESAFCKFRASAERWAVAAGRQLHQFEPKADRRAGRPLSPAVDRPRYWLCQGWWTNLTASRKFLPGWRESAGAARASR